MSKSSNTSVLCECGNKISYSDIEKKIGISDKPEYIKMYYTLGIIAVFSILSSIVMLEIGNYFLMGFSVATAIGFGLLVILSNLAVTVNRGKEYKDEYGFEIIREEE